jgi:hypothetical protein
MSRVENERAGAAYDDLAHSLCNMFLGLAPHHSIKRTLQ